MPINQLGRPEVSSQLTCFNFVSDIFCIYVIIQMFMKYVLAGGTEGLTIFTGTYVHESYIITYVKIYA